MGRTLKDYLIKDLAALGKLKTDKLIEQRIEKFCAMGVVNE
jgi:acetyl-CoA carboxylase carboxyl transferase subunit alpha